MHMERRVWKSGATAALLFATACRTHVGATKTDAPQLSGCFRLTFGDPLPPGGAGSVHYTLTSENGTLTLLDASLEVLNGAGGPSLLDGSRVIVVVSSDSVSTHGRVRMAKVRAIQRIPSQSGAAC